MSSIDKSVSVHLQALDTNNLAVIQNCVLFIRENESLGASSNRYVFFNNIKVTVPIFYESVSSSVSFQQKVDPKDVMG